MPARKEKPEDAKWVLDQHAFARDLYHEAIDFSEEVEELFTAKWNVPRDASDMSTAGGRATQLRPARARAILEKFLTLLNVRATTKVTVIPRSTGEQEMKACSKLENWLLGYQRQYMMETKKNPWRDFVYWYLLRGRGVIETRFDVNMIDSEYCPIRTIVTDPNMVYTVRGESGIGWYTKEYKRYVWDIRSELDGLKGSKKRKMPELPDDENEKVPVVEYWDKEWHALLVDEQLVWVNKHDYGFVPISEAHCMDTPLADMRWAYNSVLGPIMDSLKQQYAAASKLATGVDLFYWPKVLVQSATGQAVILDSGMPGVESHIPPDAKVTVISPTPNAQVLGQLMGWLKADEQLGGIPEIAWGAEPSSLQSGFAVSQVLSQVLDKIHDKKTNLELALGWDFSHKLQLIEKFGLMDGVNLQVPAGDAASVYGSSSRKSMLIDIKPDDVDGRNHVSVSITPELPQDRMVKSQLAQAYRTPGVDGKPLVDDQSILEMLEFEHPDLIRQRIREQLLPAQSQEINKTSIAASEQEWMQENKEVVKLAEKRQNPDKLPNMSQDQIVQLVDIMIKQKLAELMGQGGQLPQMMQQAENQPPPELIPQNGAAPGVPPEAMPTQMSMAPDDVVPDLPDLQRRQNRRAAYGRPPS
jgi:hypothetical protein